MAFLTVAYNVKAVAKRAETVAFTNQAVASI